MPFQSVQFQSAYARAYAHYTTPSAGNPPARIRHEARPGNGAHRGRAGNPVGSIEQIRDLRNGRRRSHVDPGRLAKDFLEIGHERQRLGRQKVPLRKADRTAARRKEPRSLPRRVGRRGLFESVGHQCLAFGGHAETVRVANGGLPHDFGNLLGSLQQLVGVVDHPTADPPRVRGNVLAESQKSHAHAVLVVANLVGQSPRGTQLGEIH
mmetsp:Transcript_1206/g.3053  ORF Transcript_1206/g.3053 Transcript_1206/m.3053 type:complete len:209 (-) Transcript_1206:329-955(-)